MTAMTIRVRVNPDDDEYVIFGDVGDWNGQHWLGQRTGGRWTGWEWTADVADWPEFELTISNSSLIPDRPPVEPIPLAGHPMAGRFPWPLVSYWAALRQAGHRTGAGVRPVASRAGTGDSGVQQVPMSVGESERNRVNVAPLDAGERGSEVSGEFGVGSVPLGELS